MSSFLFHVAYRRILKNKHTESMFMWKPQSVVFPLSHWFCRGRAGSNHWQHRSLFRAQAGEPYIELGWSKEAFAEHTLAWRRRYLLEGSVHTLSGSWLSLMWGWGLRWGRAELLDIRACHFPEGVAPPGSTVSFQLKKEHKFLVQELSELLLGSVTVCWSWGVWALLLTFAKSKTLMKMICSASSIISLFFMAE